MKPVVNITRLIDEGTTAGFRRRVILLCGAVAFMEGFNAQSVGYVAPALRKAWALAPHELGYFISFGLFGLMLGALLIAPLADRFGRRPVLVLSTFAFGGFSIATAFAPSVPLLDGMRFLTGLGLGASMPNAIALTSEYSAGRSRSMSVIMMFTGFIFGSIGGGLVAAAFAPRFGWQVVFLVGGALSVLLSPALQLQLPESVRFLIVSGAPYSRVEAIVRRLTPKDRLVPGADFVVDEAGTQRAGLRRLLGEGRPFRTGLLWTIFFMSLLDVYLLTSWLPTALATAGASPPQGALLGVVLQLGGLAGAVAGPVIDRFGARAALLPLYLIAAVSISAIGIAATSPWILLALFGAGVGVIGGQNGANAVAAASYPTEVRSTGVGACLGVGRIGSIVGPTMGGLLLSAHVSLPRLFLLSALPALLAAGAAACLGASPRRPIEAEASPQPS